MKNGKGKIIYHGALAPLQEACKAAGWAYVNDLMSVKKGRFRKIGIALRHAGLLLKIRTFSSKKAVLIRDFSNIPLAFVFPFLPKALKNRLFFVVNHNLQWALGGGAQRIAFFRLARQGCRFCFFEQVPSELLAEWGLNPARNMALPHPVGKTDWKRERKGGVETIGVVGEYRSEKGLDELLEHLQPLSGRYRILLAIPNLDDFSRLSPHGDASWFDRVDTGSFEAYQQAIAACDVVVLNHAKKEYGWRPSGLIADAASARVPVLARGLPVLSVQLSEPVILGACFQELSDLSTCIEAISETLKNGGYDFSAYQVARSGSSLARYLEEISL